MKMTQKKKASQQSTMKKLWVTCWAGCIVTPFVLNKTHTKHSDSGHSPSWFEDKHLPCTTTWDFGQRRILLASPQIQKSKQKYVLFFQGCYLGSQSCNIKFYSPMKFFVTWVLFLSWNSIKSPVFQPDSIAENNTRAWNSYSRYLPSSLSKADLLSELHSIILEIINIINGV